MKEVRSSLEINNLTGFDVSEDFLLEVCKKTLMKSEMECLFKKNISVSLALVSEEEIKRLNLEYRSKNQPTDVLSFSEYAKNEDLCNNKEEDIFLGEIILCPSYIKMSSVEQGTSFMFETAYIFSHGILHLLGFGHGRKMFSIQEEIAKNIK